MDSSIYTAEIYLMKIIYFVICAVLVQYSFIYMLVASIFSAV